MNSVLGIDPGASQSAFVLWDGKKILDKGICPNEEMLWTLQAIDANESPGAILAIEHMISIPEGAGKSVCDTIWWSGRFYEAWEGKRDKVPVHVVKKALAAKNDVEIRHVLIQRFGAPGNAQHPGFTYGLQAQGYHLWRSFAVAVAWYDHLAFQAKEMK